MKEAGAGAGAEAGALVVGAVPEKEEGTEIGAREETETETETETERGVGTGSGRQSEGLVTAGAGRCMTSRIRTQDCPSSMMTREAARPSRPR